MSFINFKPEEFSYLNITSLGLEHVQNGTECGFACLKITSCFSYNLATFSDLSGKLLCELLPSDKFNNSDKFTFSPLYHHFSIPVSTNWIMLLRFFQEDQKFSQNSLKKCHCLLRVAVGAWCFIAQNRLAKYTDCHVQTLMRLCGGRISLGVCRGETLWFLEESYLNTYTVSTSLSGEVVNILN